ncbi:MAG: electron transfer flavoprotein subunit beta/FixA family protein [Magnetococcus sp. YQC-5]
MRVVVAVKQVPDPMAPVRVRRDGGGVEIQGARPILNPFDAIALEAALRLRETGCAAEVIAVTVGPLEWEGTLRTALAMGADRAIRVEWGGEASSLAPLSCAGLLAALVRRESAGLVITGRQSVDCDHGQVGPMIAGLLGWGQAAFAIELRIENGQVIVKREVDGGQETVGLDLPAVITADLRLNTPRYASLPGIMRARNKPVEQIDPAILGVSLASHVVQLGVLAPEPRKPGIRVLDVAELATRMQALGLAHG